jgi:hypothetical protein
MKALAPEDIELNKKQAKLERLKERLADRERWALAPRSALGGRRAAG